MHVSVFNYTVDIYCVLICAINDDDGGGDDDVPVDQETWNVEQ